MKLIYMTDIHANAAGFRGRSDDYFETCKKKLAEVLNYAAGNHIKTILCGGDFFEHPRPGYFALNSILDILIGFDGAIYINPGNHDLFGWNPKSYPRTVMRTLNQMPNIIVLPENGMHVLSRENNILIRSVWAQYDREGDKRVFEIKRDTDTEENYIILMAHTMLVEDWFFGGYVKIDDVPINNTADLILGSHYHPGWPTRQSKAASGRQVTFANPGSLCRITKTSTRRIPKYLEIDINNSSNNMQEWTTTIKEIELECAELWPFKEEAKIVPDKEVQYGPIFEDFLEHLLDPSADRLDLNPRSLAVIIAEKEKFADNVLRRVLDNLDAVEKES